MNERLLEEHRLGTKTIEHMNSLIKAFEQRLELLSFLEVTPINRYVNLCSALELLKEEMQKMELNPVL